MTHPLEFQGVAVEAQQFIHQRFDGAPRSFLGYPRRVCYSLLYLLPSSLVTLYLFQYLLRFQQNPLNLLIHVPFVISWCCVLEIQEYIVSWRGAAVRIVPR